MSLFTLTRSSGDVIPVEGEMLFGRGTECSVRLDDSEVSRKHATIYVAGGRLMIRDEGSANGTFVNGQKLETPTTLTQGDEIRIGQTMLTVQVSDAEDITATMLAPEALSMPQVVGSTHISEHETPPAKKSKLPLIAIGCGALVIITLCGLVAVFLISGVGFFQDLLGGLDLFSGASPDLTYSLEEVLQEESIDDRPGVVSYLGLPDAFTISAISLEGVPVRVETWRYFAFEMRVDFVDGEATWTMDIEPAPEDSILPAWYDPLAFELGMSLSEVAHVATTASPAGMTPEVIDLSEGGEDLAGGTMMVGDQILIGLDPSGVVYIETIALFPEGEGGS